MRPSLLSVFAGKNIKNCLDQESNREFYIDDPLAGPPYIIKYIFHPEIEQLLFKVTKDDDRIINFLAIDGCLIGRAAQISRCDFLLFDANTICLVEMKMRSDIDGEDLSARDTRVKAASQIIATYNYLKQEFADKGLTFSYPFIEGIISVPDNFPKSNATEKMFVDEFLTLHGIPLYIDSQKIFD